MVFRNQRHLEALQVLYARDGEAVLDSSDGGRKFLDTVVFEYDGRASLSWDLPDSEMKCLENQFQTGRRTDANRAMARLIELWAR